jgi:hypothetical protein
MGSTLIGIGSVMGRGLASYASTAGSTIVTPAMTRPPIDSGWARASPQAGRECPFLSIGGACPPVSGLRQADGLVDNYPMVMHRDTARAGVGSVPPTALVAEGEVPFDPPPQAGGCYPRLGRAAPAPVPPSTLPEGMR